MKYPHRIKYIDYAKAIAILFVVMGHAAVCPNSLKQWIYTFHMPLFFTFYGMTWKMQSAPLGAENLKKKIRRFLFPFLFWAFAYTLVNNCIKHTFSASHFVLDLYGSQTALKKANSLTSLWFLTCFLAASLIFDAVMSYIENRENKIMRNALRGLFLGSAFGAGCFLSKVLPIGIGYPWNLNVAFMAMFFIQVGYYSRNALLKVYQSGIRVKAAICAASFALLTMTFRLNLNYIPINNVDMASSNYGNLFLFLIDAIAGILFVVSFGMILENLGDFKELSFIGKNTMAIMVLHKPIVQNLTWGISSPGIARAIITIGFSVGTVIAATGCAMLLNRFIPFCIGNRKKEPVF